MSETENDIEVLDGCAVCEGADLQSLPLEFNMMSLCTEHRAALSRMQGPGREVQAIEQATQQMLPSNPMEMVARALEKGVDPQMLQQFMDLQERYESNEARKAYAADMVKCQKQMPTVMAQVEGEKTGSLYAKMGHINQLITPIYTKAGFSISFGHGVAATEGEIRTTARVLHKLGHYEDFFIDLPPDMAGAQGTVNKTAIHARASSNTYGQRYIVKGIFNLSILSEDDDGTLAGGNGVSNRVSEEESMALSASILDWGLNGDAVLREFAIANWEQLPTKKLEKARKRIQQLGEARRR